MDTSCTVANAVRSLLGLTGLCPTHKVLSAHGGSSVSWVYDLAVPKFVEFWSQNFGVIAILSGPLEGRCLHLLLIYIYIVLLYYIILRQAIGALQKILRHTA